jgi:transposase InsO family protein
MEMHKRTRVTPLARQEIWRLYSEGKHKITVLAEKFGVSRPTIYKVIQRARVQEFAPRKSVNKRFLNLNYGIKRLAKIEATLERKLAAKARRYNKQYPGEMIHVDGKRLPLLNGEDTNSPREYLFVAIDDFSRELYAAILPDKTQGSTATFLKQVIDECPYTIECVYSDNGTEFKGTLEHAFVQVASAHNIAQKFTRPARPQTNGKAERVIRTLMEMWHGKIIFLDRHDRQISLVRFVNFYNTVKPHASLDNLTPYEKLINYFSSTQTVNNP